MNKLNSNCIYSFFKLKLSPLVARGQPPVADFGMGNPFHHPLPSRDPCDCLTLQRNFLGTNLPRKPSADDTNFTSFKFLGK